MIGKHEQIVYLFGDWEQCVEFKDQCIFSGKFRGKFGIYSGENQDIDEFQDGYRLIKHDVHAIDINSPSFQHSLEFLIPDAKVIIYLNLSEEQKNQVESVRNEKECIAIDFSALSLTPVECLNRIPIHVSEHVNAIESSKNIINSTLYAMLSFPDLLPIELCLVICKMMLPSITFAPKPIYIDLPLTPKTDIVNEESEGLLELEVKNDEPKSYCAGCALF